MTDVFISYAHEDRDWVAQLAAALEAAGLTVWWTVSARFGQSDDEEIEEALAAAKSVIAVWSRAALGARNVKAEAGDALDRNLLLSALKEDVTPPLAFRELPGGDLTGWTGGPHPGLEALIAAVKGQLGGAPPSPVAPAEADPPDDRTRVLAPAADERTMFRPRALRAGEIVAHYRIVGPLGEGGSGAIYEAHNIHNEDERVALKIIQPGMEDREHFFGFLRAEANALQLIKHDAVVQYRTFGRIPDSDEFFLVIEFVQGRTLADAMRRAPLDAEAIRQLAARLCAGLAAAHAYGVIHRDLSPDNVMLPGGDPARATLIDFGIARTAAFDPLGRSFAGKLSYCAPEQFKAEDDEIGPWSDLYSLGLLLAAAARGKKLDMGRDLFTAVERRRTIPELEGVPAELHHALGRLLEPDPALRVRSAVEAAALFAAPSPLLAAAEADPDKPLIVIRDPEPAPVAEPVPAPAPEPPEPAGDEPPPRRPLLKLIGVGLAAAAAVVAAFLILRPADVALPEPPPEIAGLRPSEDVVPETPPPADEVVPEAVIPDTPPPVETDTAPDALIAPALADIVRQARDTAALARTAEAEAKSAADAARLAEVSARNVASEADAAAANACADGADPRRYLCGSNDDTPIDYRGEVTTGADGQIQPHGLGVLAAADGVVHRGMFASGAAAGEGVRGTAGRDCAGAWIGDALGPLGVCVVHGGADAAGHRIAGSYRDTRAHGPAAAVFEDGAVFSGQFVDGVKDGAGVIFTAGGLRAELAYRADAPVLGIVFLAKDGAPAGHYEGELGPAPARETGLPVSLHGLGVLYAADGTISAQGRWQDGKLAEPMGEAGGGAAGLEPLPPLPDQVLDPRLAEAMTAAADAVMRAEAAAVEADAIGVKATETATEADAAAAKGVDAADKAVAARKKACVKSPPKGYGCFKMDGETSYGGQVKCDTAGTCVSAGYGVLTFADGWDYQGFWGKKAIELGCEAEKGVRRFCGQEGSDPALGMFMRDDGLVMRGLTNVKADTLLGTYDFSAVKGSKIKIIRGTALKGLVDGPGVLEGMDGSRYRGGWSGSKRSGPALSNLADGGRIAAIYAKGVPVVGERVYPDGSRYQGEFGGGDGFTAIPNGLGAFYSAEGRLLRQGRWQGGVLVENFAPGRNALADQGLAGVVAPAAMTVETPDVAVTRPAPP